MEIRSRNNNNLHRTLRFLLIFAQIFVFFPVQGFLDADVRSLKFSWYSAVALFSLLTCVIGWLDALAHIRIMILNGFNAHYMNGGVFVLANSTFCFLFVILAKEWPKFMKKWAEVEGQLAKYGWAKKIDLKIKLISIILLSLELAEHLTVQINKTLVAFHCKDSTENSLRYLFAEMTFPQIFDLIEYSVGTGVFLQMMNSRFACIWTYVDLFIIVIILYTAARFQQITKQLKYMKNNRIKALRKWRIIRRDYNQLCRVCYLTNKKLSNLILLSFATNLYYIIFHLFRVLNVTKTTLEVVYFIILFGLLCLRTACICWYGGWVYEESQAPIKFLTSTAHTIYNVEIERFVYEVQYQSVGITGKGFFNINKTLILKIASALLTYELVLIQINEVSVKETSYYSLCQ